MPLSPISTTNAKHRLELFEILRRETPCTLTYLIFLDDMNAMHKMKAKSELENLNHEAEKIIAKARSDAQEIRSEAKISAEKYVKGIVDNYVVRDSVSRLTVTRNGLVWDL